MAQTDTIQHTSRSKNNADLRTLCLIGGVIAGLSSYGFFSGGNAESGSWAAFIALAAFGIASQIQVEWSSKSRG